MKSASTTILTVLFCLLVVRLQAAEEPKLSPLPAPVSNNAVAISHDDYGSRIFSFMGIGPKKTWDAITASAYEMDPGTGKWTEKRPVPGVAGRLAASAVALHDQVFIFGGYVVDAQGGEARGSDLNVFFPAENRYYRGKDIPVPVDDAVVGYFTIATFFWLAGGRRPKMMRFETFRSMTRIRTCGCKRLRYKARRGLDMLAPFWGTPLFTWPALTRTRRGRAPRRL